MHSKNFIIISPVRNEAANIERTITSVLAQSCRPLLWVIVDDGSSDGTTEIIRGYSAKHSWLRLVILRDRGYYDLMEAGEIKAFYEGLSTVGNVSYEYLAKLDGDIALEPNYYEEILRRFAENLQLGIASGTCWHIEKGQKVREVVYKHHVRGAMRVYRKACWDDIGGVPRSLGWDAIDCYKARMHGWVTRSFNELPVTHLVKTWEKGGWLHGRQRSGRMEYLIGTHPLFFAAKCARDLCVKPYLISASALAWGYLRSFLKNEPRVGDLDLIAQVRKEQLTRIRNWFSGWTHRRALGSKEIF